MSTLLIQTKQNDSIKIVLAFAAIYIIWGTTYLAIRMPYCEMKRCPLRIWL